MPQNDEQLSPLSLPYMVRWFSPTVLAKSAVRAAVSPVFGTFADARAMQANVDGFDRLSLEHAARRYDLSEAGMADPHGVVWVDYIADTGDGFDSTYAMASLIAEPRITVSRAGSKDAHQLPAGRVLILGGDQVYPFPSRDEYQQRFVFPFEMAFSDLSLPRKTFVIPGNHDWYDGLNGFDFLFCQARYGEAGGRRIGSLELTQHRSYFAVRLPYNWWIWGADIQFSDYLDAGQVRYFQTVAELMRPRDGEAEHKVILCTAAPGWQYEGAEARAANSNIRALAAMIEEAGAKVCAVVSGDSHHYCRYHSRTLGLNLVTAGGGGAFLHPTHHLYSDITYRWQGDEHKFDLYCRKAVEGSGRTWEESCWPSRMQSYWLAWGNTLFPLWNYTFATFLGTLYWLMTWMYSQTPIVGREGCQRGYHPLVEDILLKDAPPCGLTGDGFFGKAADILQVTAKAGVYQFLLGIFGLAMLVGLVMYADHRSRWMRLVMGTLHWLAHLVAMVGLYMLVNYHGYWTYLGEWTRVVFEPILGSNYLSLRTVMYMVQMIFGGGLVAGFVWGLYLFIACAFLGRHTNDGFSSLRNPNYKNFLRMKIEPDRLTMFPIGLRRTPTRIEWRRSQHAANKLVPRFPLSPELIDGPVVIEAAQVRRRPAPPAASA